MSIHPDIQDQAYQFFVEEAPELLELLEAGILALPNDRSTAKVHNLMRAAHSLKGSSASVGLNGIKDIAHRLESIFKALYSESVVIDTNLETLLLQAYDALRNPLMQQISTGRFDQEQAIAQSDPVFSILEELLSDELERADDYIPSSAEMGVDMVASIFEVDVEQGIERLQTVLQYSDLLIMRSEIEAQVEVFEGIAELLNLKGFGAIATTTRKALKQSPEQVEQIGQLCLTDFQAARMQVMAGKRTGEGEPCLELVALATGPSRSPSPQLLSEDPTFQTSPQARVGDNLDFLDDTDALDSSLRSLDLELTESWNNLSETDALEELDDLDGLEDLDSLNGPEDLDSLAKLEELDGLEKLNELEELDGLEDLDGLEGLDGPKELNGFDELNDTLRANDRDTEVLTDENFTDFSDDEFSLALETVLSALEEPSTEPQITAVNHSTSADSPTLEEQPQSQSSTARPQPLPPPPPPSPGSAIYPKPSGAASKPVTPPPPPSTINRQPSASAPNQITPPPPPSTISSTSPVSTPSLTNLRQTFDLLPQVDEQSLPAIPSHKRKQPTSPPQTIDAEIVTEEAIAPLHHPPDSPSSVPTKRAEQQNQGPIQTASKTIDVAQPAPSFSVRVRLDRLERMDNQVGELSINRNGLSLQQEQLERAARELTHRFSRFQSLVEQLRESSDKMLIAPSRQQNSVQHRDQLAEKHSESLPWSGESTFDPLEMDQYSVLYSQLQGLLEEVVQIEESVGDVTLFTQQSNRTLQEQRQTLNQLRHELMWARMLPLGEVLNRFPRVLRDMSAKYKKPVNLRLVGTGVLVDRAVLEKLYDPLLHLLRNAFDHGIESAEQRQRSGKPTQGTIEIRAYHQGNKTMIEIRDDGSGLNLEKIVQQAIDRGLVSIQTISNASPAQIFEMIFEPGFSTAGQVSDISGRGVGLDIVRSRLRDLQGTITVTSEPGSGTTFTLCLPLTLTIAKLLVCSVGTTAIALPSDSIEEIVVPKENQVRQSEDRRFLSWRNQIVPIQSLSSLLDYHCPVRQTALSRALAAAPMPREWALPLLVLQRDQQFIALEINRLVTEQELVIKPFSKAIAPPSYAYGCTILGDGALLPVIDGYVLIDRMLGQSTTSTQINQFKSNLSEPIGLIMENTDSLPPSPNTSSPNTSSPSNPLPSTTKSLETPQILIVDDAATLRRTLALTLQRVGYQVIQARDGWEAIERLETSQSIHLIICDIEMPNMNGFEFLNYRRQHQEMKTIPVAMLTSRSNDKHRQLAIHLGADAYFTKPYTEHEFITSINDILRNTDAQEQSGQFSTLPPR